MKKHIFKDDFSALIHETNCETLIWSLEKYVDWHSCNFILCEHVSSLKCKLLEKLGYNVLECH